MNYFGGFLYTHQAHEIVAFDSASLILAFEALQNLQNDYFLLGYIAYEAHLALTQEYHSSTPLLYFQAFKTKEPFTPTPLNHIFHPQNPTFIHQDSYTQAINELKNQIKLGNTYQGNFTTFFDFTSTLSPQEIFLSLLSRQNTPYTAFLQTPYESILSFSPELFFSIQNNLITTKPMKGTIKRGETPQQDRENAKFLSQDIKNRSENVMIVDLLRNDLSKLATQGSVKVDKLFEIETYPTLFQMTSTISATLRPNLTLLEIFKALFPCGSITGAPKLSTMQILSSLENSKRGIYCGALGEIYQNNATFSIPIRTIFAKTHTPNYYHYGVGSGVVWDSNAEEEYLELQTKMKFLYPQFSLIETIAYYPTTLPPSFEAFSLPSFCGGFVLLHSHLARLQASSLALGFSYPHSLKDELLSLHFDTPTLLRIELSKEGSYTLTSTPLTLSSLHITTSKRILKSDLYSHKTTLRDWTLQAQEQIQRGEIFDCIYYDEEGYLLEGTRSNLILELPQGLFTPEHKGQFLQGIGISTLLSQQQIQQAPLKLQDLSQAKQVFCVNSARGMLKVNLI